MKGKGEYLEFLKFIKTKDLFRELGKRLDVQYGKIEVKFRQGEPCEFANVDRRIDLEGETKSHG